MSLKPTPQHMSKKSLASHRLKLLILKGLMGDTSDNYPGVTKVGEKQL